MFHSSFKVANNIESLPFHDLGVACQQAQKSEIDSVVEDFSSRLGLKYKDWLYPQLLAHIAKWTLNRNSNNEYCALELLKTNCVDPFNRGVYYFCVSNTRALQKQYSSSGAPFCKFVPLILAAFLKMRHIPYTAWGKKHLGLLVHSQLWEVMNEKYYPYSRKDLLQFRDMGLLVKSGKSSGHTKSAHSTYGLNGLPHTWEIIDLATNETATVKGPGTLHPYTRMMLCQTWCAHPQNRNKYMILDPQNWDSMPEPLVDENPLAQQKTETLTKLPWEV